MNDPLKQRRLAITGASALLLLLSGACRETSAAPAQPPPPEVRVVTLAAEDVKVFGESLARVDGLVNAEIRARIPGYIQSQAYREGTYVKKGDLLFTIDPSLTAASSKKAAGELSASNAALAKASADITRLEKLVQYGVGSQQELDDARAAKQLAQANVLASQGDLDAASANLSYTKIVAPISGLVGQARVSVGSLVGQGDATLLTTISQIDTVRVSYSISEQAYLANPGRYRTEAPDPSRGDLELVLADGSHYPKKGALSFLDREVDDSTGTFTALALFPNPDGLLRPGQYAKVRSVKEEHRGVLCIPQRAVSELQGTRQVMSSARTERSRCGPS